jgi:hypothetical protein
LAEIALQMIDAGVAVNMKSSSNVNIQRIIIVLGHLVGGNGSF